MSKLYAALCSLLLTAFLSSAAQATPVVLNAYDSGWYKSNGYHSPSNTNYYAGKKHNNFFAFDMSDVEGSIVSATLSIFNPCNGYESNDYSEWFALFDVNTDISTLLSGFGGVNAYNDLGSGELFGATRVSWSSNYSYIDIVLNSAALTALNAANDLFALGGSLITANDGIDFLFGYSDKGYNGGNIKLKLETESVPVSEPGVPALLAIAFCAFILNRKTSAGKA
ncbi:hypothetical protein O5O45_24670 [Hahella aquimaris]|uniref:hypothetical protein n=1 Tax=Hahella sp. HNIBRBA332 TaxID=3015983 RepID=UPI00273BA8FB|nr:hypothetical protein [Hahella sp. HNIBRBA332]WLQ12925.1 hypothetical protein O5O45_24670 [Hahella sp. HNIBRBA332]